MVLGPNHPVFRRHPGDPMPGSGGAPDDEPLLPAELRTDLSALFGAGPAIPAAVDRAVLEDARHAFTRRRTPVVFTFRRFAAALATAAVLGLAVLIAVPSRPPRPVHDRTLALDRPAGMDGRRGGAPSVTPASPMADRSAGPGIAGGGGTPATEAGEAARSRGFARRLEPAQAYREGAVTIVDALVVARAVGADAKSNSSFDVTGDGAVDQRDVDAIAALAVSLAANSARGRTGPGGPG